MHLGPTSKLGYLSFNLADVFPYVGVRCQTYNQVTGALDHRVIILRNSARVTVVISTGAHTNAISCWK